VAVAFLFAQTFSTSHAHDHSDTAPLNQSCEVCILAVSDDIDIAVALDLSADLDDASAMWETLNRLALPEPKQTPRLAYAVKSIDPPPDPSLRPDAARAPPLYI